ncbi:MAG: hypothetical protein H0W38_03450 [Methylibium sp.]|nr:hypothetical protein [Methylibium sp.]
MVIEPSFLCVSIGVLTRWTLLNNSLPWTTAPETRIGGRARMLGDATGMFNFAALSHAQKDCRPQKGVRSGCDTVDTHVTLRQMQIEGYPRI